YYCFFLGKKMIYVTFLIFLVLLLTLTHWPQSSDSKNKDNGKKNQSNKENVKVDEVPEKGMPSMRKKVVDSSLTDVKSQICSSIAEKQTPTDNLQTNGCETKNNEITSELKGLEGAHVPSSSLNSIVGDISESNTERSIQPYDDSYRLSRLFDESGSVEKFEKPETLENSDEQKQDLSSNRKSESSNNQHAHDISKSSTEGSIKSPDNSDETYNSDAESDASFEAINPKEKIDSSLSNSGIG
ncbi:hypothetical protein N9Y17_03240, partial [Gammaproteobacteria bacterium]|nr:hypothetical protein [Gammaproteobacteria bacterium]